MVPMVLVVFLLLVCVAATAGVKPAVGRVIAGSLLYVLGVASVLPDRPDLISLPVDFVAVSAGFIWLGGGLIIWGLVTAFRSREKLVVHRLGAVIIGVGL